MVIKSQVHKKHEVRAKFATLRVFFNGDFYGFVQLVHSDNLKWAAKYFMQLFLKCIKTRESIIIIIYRVLF